MAAACCHNCEKMTKTTAEGDEWLANTRTFSWLMAIQLLVAVCANVYLLRVTSQRRFSVHWDTFRVVLRHSSVVDLSLCVAVAGVVIWSSLVLNNDTLTVSCACYTLDQVLLAGAVVVAGGIVVCCRQAFVLVLFSDETPLLREHRFRVVNILRTVSVVAVVGLVIAALARCLLPSFEWSLCFVVGTVPPRAGYLLVVPVVVHFCLGVAFVAQAKPSEAGRKQSPSVHIDVSCEKLVEQSLLTEQDGRTGLSYSRWRCFIVEVNVGINTWLTMAAAMVMAGTLLPPPTVDTLLVMIGCTAAFSVWTSISVFLHWT
ncbi:hypothetical protein NP493_994g00017 [Ridgeia piscesae]|uniref:Uncharacterized protein n=1 Tax=Ridgeia piscesae TaxID=27915 RepID=A0AAD9NKX7_RIDPI|nr:hypothetical protein NP493_994g00017 [Ridgeia piscesae]